MKEQIIQIPDTLEIKEIKDGKIILVEKEKKLTYKDVANNALSKKQLEKLLAINKLMNVAKYLNGDWQPDWDNRHEKKYYIFIENEQIRIYYVDTVQSGDVYFKSEELAKQAIEILGEETIKLELCTDY